MLYMIRLVCACTHKLLRSVYSPQTLSSQLVLFKSHLATAQEHLLQLYAVYESVSSYKHVGFCVRICVCVCMSIGVYLWPWAVPATCSLHGWISLYSYRRWLAAHICVKMEAWSSKYQVCEPDRRREWVKRQINWGRKKTKRSRTQLRIRVQLNKCLY